MKGLRVRLWLLALVCVGAGLTCRVVLAVLAPPQSRAEEWDQCTFTVICMLVACFCSWHTVVPWYERSIAEEIPGCWMALLWGDWGDGGILVLGHALGAGRVAAEPDTTPDRARNEILFNRQERMTPSVCYVARRCQAFLRHLAS